MYRIYQLQQEILTNKINWYTHFWITFTKAEIFCSNTYPPGRVKERRYFIDQKSLSISSIQIDYINIYKRSGCGRNSERANTVQTKWNLCGDANHTTENVSNGSERNRKKLVRLVIQTIDERNVRLNNVLNVDLKIT